MHLCCRGFWVCCRFSFPGGPPRDFHFKNFSDCLCDSVAASRVSVVPGPGTAQYRIGYLRMHCGQPDIPPRTGLCLYLCVVNCVWSRVCVCVCSHACVLCLLVRLGLTSDHQPDRNLAVVVARSPRLGYFRCLVESERLGVVRLFRCLVELEKPGCAHKLHVAPRLGYFRCLVEPERPGCAHKLHVARSVISLSG